VDRRSYAEKAADAQASRPIQPLRAAGMRDSAGPAIVPPGPAAGTCV